MLDTYVQMLGESINNNNGLYGLQFMERMNKEREENNMLAAKQEKLAAKKSTQQLKRAPLKFYVAKNLGLLDAAKNGDDTNCEKAEIYLKQNGVDCFVFKTGDKAVFAIKKPADKKKLVDERNYSQSEYASFVRAAKIAGCSSFTFKVGFKAQKEATYANKVEAERKANQPKLVIHKKNGGTITLKKNGEKVVSELFDLLWNDMITEDEANDFLYDCIEEGVLEEGIGKKIGAAALGVAMAASRAPKANAQDYSGRCKTPSEVEAEEGGNLGSQIMKLDEAIIEYIIKNINNQKALAKLEKMQNRLNSSNVTQHDVEAIRYELEQSFGYSK